MRGTKDLLEDLAERLDCIYLSDLRTEKYRSRAVHAALEFSPEDYSVFQWRDAANYLLDLTEPPQTTAEARKLLQEWEAAFPSKN
ncbi:hypothetical protein SDC9_93755 [bioreactor metagenome]|uniref:Uncharacterized protein n=1 Tax=bioreactor metagenome TaxID=1076179 RepID=A0A645A1U3_9ZZZZ|nr:hypothetical protein [Oscillibacter sp.]